MKSKKLSETYNNNNTDTAIAIAFVDTVYCAYEIQCK